MTITEFLLARIAEDEDEARNDDPVPTPVGMWAPARVLAECEAKRRIVEAFEDERVRRDIYNRDYDSGDYYFNANDLRARLASNAHCRGLEIAMLALASVYVEHPDFAPAWRA